MNNAHANFRTVGHHSQVPPSKRILQIPRSKVRLINEARHLSENNRPSYEAQANAVDNVSDEQPIRVMDSNVDDDRSAGAIQGNHNQQQLLSTFGLFEDSRSPEMPDRKRYAQKEKVNLGLYQPSFTMAQNPALSKDTINFASAAKRVANNSQPHTSDVHAQEVDVGACPG